MVADGTILITRGHKRYNDIFAHLNEATRRGHIGTWAIEKHAREQLTQEEMERALAQIRQSRASLPTRQSTIGGRNG